MCDTVSIGNPHLQAVDSSGKNLMESPNRGMSSGATHQAGSQRVTVPNLTHPWPTFNMGRDEGVSFLWYRIRKFDLMYFLDWNSEFQPLSICVTTLHLAKLADMTGTLPTSM
jgi:hypothetical protein